MSEKTENLQFLNCIFSPKQNGCIFCSRKELREEYYDTGFLPGKLYSDADRENIPEASTFVYCGGGDLSRYPETSEEVIVTVEVSVNDNGGGMFVVDPNGFRMYDPRAQGGGKYGFQAEELGEIISKVLDYKIEQPIWIKIQAS